MGKFGVFTTKVQSVHGINWRVLVLYELLYRRTVIDDVCECIRRTRLCGCFLDRNDAIGSIFSSLRVQRVDKHHVSIPVLGQLLFDGIWKYTVQFRIQLQKFSDGTDRTILNRFRRTKDDRPPILE